MNDQNLKAAAERLFLQITAPAISEYEKEQLAIRANRDRLRAERLAREATSLVTWGSQARMGEGERTIR
jgi:hypothetical protein